MTTARRSRRRPGLAWEADPLIAAGATRAEAARRLGVPRNTLDQAMSRRSLRAMNRAPSPVQRPRLVPARPGSETGHGTYLGFLLHRDRGEEPCGPCAGHRLPPVTRDEAARHRETAVAELRAWQRYRRGPAGALREHYRAAS
jgi:hypothetical protein